MLSSRINTHIWRDKDELLTHNPILEQCSSLEDHQ